MPINPLYGATLLNIGGGLLSGWLGNRGADAQRRAQQMWAERMGSPQRLLAIYQMLLPQILGSSAFGAAQREMLAGSNAAQGAMARSFADRGLSGSGIGMLSKAAGTGLGAFGMGNLRAQASNQAMSQAQQLMGLTAAGMQGYMAPNIWGQVGGAMLNNFGGIADQWMKQPPGAPPSAAGFAGPSQLGLPMWTPSQAGIPNDPFSLLNRRWGG